jgi:Ca2+:H+ antiporter
MYESTPQHIIDEESAPGPVAAWMESSSDDSSSSSSSDSDGSSGSNTTAKRIRRMMKPGRRRRKSSFGSKETADIMDATRTPSLGTSSISPLPTDQFSEEPAYFGHRLGAIDIAEDGDDEHPRRSRKSSVHNMSKKERKRERKRQEKKHRKKARRNGDDTIAEGADTVTNEKAAQDLDAPRRVDFAVVEPQVEQEPQSDASKSRPFTLRNITTSIRPRIPETFSQNVFTQPTPNTEQVPTAGPIPRVRYGIRRTNSLPDRLHQTYSASAGQGQRIPPSRVTSAAVAVNNEKPEGEEENISRTTAIFLLLISTGLVAVCAEFMVDSINAVVESNSGLSEAFIGLIILPIVGNAAEHVTAVTVASKNKMDLAIGVAVGSSIQIALFVTPFVVLLGWCMGKEMSLYFTLFETVSLFVSAFIVNFLVLDGRSNYLEGALLCAAYVIIAVAAFFYPVVSEQSNLGGNAEAANKMVRALFAV